MGLVELFPFTLAFFFFFTCNYEIIQHTLVKGSWTPGGPVTSNRKPRKPYTIKKKNIPSPFISIEIQTTPFFLYRRTCSLRCAYSMGGRKGYSTTQLFKTIGLQKSTKERERDRFEWQARRPMGGREAGGWPRPSDRISCEGGGCRKEIGDKVIRGMSPSYD